MEAGLSHLRIRRVEENSSRLCDDTLAVEEPLEIRLSWAGGEKAISITMRTPGQDLELAAGFLFSEGIIFDASDLIGIAPCGLGGNTVKATLSPDASVDLKRLERHFYTSSSCGVCGKSSIEALRVQSRFVLGDGPVISASQVHLLPDRLREAQGLFASTGGLHGAALFDVSGKLLSCREDVGRHNAVDKLLGRCFLDGRLPLSECILMVSGRASFELIQKASMAGIGIFAAVGAPSSLGVELAKSSGMTLLGFVRNGRFNIYSGEERIRA